ncbi:MAG: SIS domain-containing protein [Actinobacteria bacterium]|nr:SIS domain-containing protein [Actinomycetota bacterium]
MNPDLFLIDLERKPEVLAALATALRTQDPWVGAPITPESRIVLLGMGSSHYANCVAAARLRTRGIDAVAELASSDLMPAVSDRTVVVAVSASGGSAETLHAVAGYRERCPVVALTNVEGSAVTEGAALPMLAQAEAGGVAGRSFQHTLALLLGLESRLTGTGDVPALVEASAAATADLLERQDEWLPPLIANAIGPDGTHIVAPARRMSSAQQGALMLREGPRLPAVGCETGDWSHVDVYLTKTTDYRLLLFAGSRWEPELERWVRERGSRLVSIGADVEGAVQTIRYRGDVNDDVRLLTEVFVTELLASSAWSS